VNITLLKALIASVPATLLLLWSAAVFFKARTGWSVIQLLGAGCLLMVVVTHICEALQLLPWMHWGDEHSVGHYLDLSSAVLGVPLLPLRYLCQRLRTRLSLFD
jgi:hypothetical protein